MKFDPKDIVEHLRHNLERYPYGDGFTVFRELLQNADDAKSAHVVLRYLEGWPGADNPLLRGPGLLLVNDGQFDAQSAEGMQTFGGSVKASDQEAVGRFGLGQKSVFHICDAFVVVPNGYGGELRPFVVNPFETLGQPGDACLDWGGISSGDTELIISASAEDGFNGGCLALWFPLRRAGLRPKPKSSGIEASDIAAESLRTLADRWRLAELLASLRRVQRIDVEVAGASVSVDRGDAARVTGYALGPGERRFGGGLGHGITSVGRERMGPSDFRSELRLSAGWPRSRNRLTDEEEPQKASPHGAVILLADREGEDELSVDWSVLLPVAEALSQVPTQSAGRVKLLLHGCFFVDSGRKEIAGLTDDPDEISEQSRVRAGWNRALRNEVVLQLVPAVLHDALSERILSSEALATIVAALADSEFGRRHRTAMAGEGALARVVEDGRGGAVAIWRYVPAPAALRPLPPPDERGRVALAGIVPGLGDWAAARGIKLICGPESVLSAEPPRWLPDELEDLIGRVESSIFVSQARTEGLAQFLTVAAADEDLRVAAASSVLERLRQALSSDRTLAPHESISRVLAAIDCPGIVALPPSASDRSVLRALAGAHGARVCLPQAWLGGTASAQPLNVQEGLPLIEALQPMLRNEKQAEAAGAAAATLVRSLGDLRSALDHPQWRQLLVLRALDGQGTRPVSLGDLDEAGRSRRIFRDSPPARKRLRLVRDALPDCIAFVVPNAVATVLEDASGSLALSELTKGAAAEIVDAGGAFGAPEARAALLKDIFTESPAARDALRMLAAGDRQVAGNHAHLVALAQTAPALDSLLRRLIAGSSGELLVPATITDRLDPQAVRHLGIETLDKAGLGSLLTRHAEELAQMGLDEEAAAAILASQIPDADLKQLAVFRDRNGGWHKADAIWRDNPQWPVPHILQDIVPLLAPLRQSTAREQAETLLSAWTPDTQVAVCLSQPDPSSFALEIMRALEKATRPDISAVRGTPWLRDSSGRPWSPDAVLDLHEEVMTAAADVLGQSNESFVLPITDIAADLRDAQVVDILRNGEILGDAARMTAGLLERIAEVRPIAVFEPVSALPSQGLARLARTGVDLQLPGWPLLAAMLRHSDDPTRAAHVFGAVPPDRPELAARALTVLAELAQGSGAELRAVYEWGFRAVAKWPVDARTTALGQALVPTREGSWRPGRDVAGRGGGVAPSSLLDDVLLEALPAPMVGENADANRRDPSVSGRPEQANPEAFRGEVLQGLKEVVEYAKPHVPQDLLILLIGLLGRSEAFKSLALTVLEARQADLSRVWQRLDDEVAVAFRASEQHLSLDARREDNFLILLPVVEPPKTIKVETLSGELRPLPVVELKPLGVLGNLHSGGFTYFVRQQAIRRKSVRIGTPRAEAVTSRAVKELCTAVAEIMIGHRSEQLKAFEVLESLAEDCDRVDQTRLASVIAELEDQLPHILGELKPLKGTRLRQARDAYRDTIDAAPAVDAREQARPQAKAELWRVTDAARDELLGMVRERIKDYGYDEGRVLFELFQNADDAAVQHPPAEEARFRVEPHADHIRTLHWGRLLTHQGPSKEVGEREGYAHDLSNMLLLNFSEKSEDVTGRFGLGFKSVHLVASEVRIASRWVACRVHGGMLPSEWPEGPKISEKEKRAGRPATVIDLDFDPERCGEISAQTVLDAFRTAAPWLPVMSRKIRRLEIDGEGTWIAERVSAGTSGIDIVRISGSDTRRAIAIELGEETTLFLPVDREGPVSVEPETPRLWLMAPLEERLKTGWLMNRMGFRVDPGRGRLAGTEDEKVAVFENLGTWLGERLLALFDLVRDDWTSFAAAIFRGPSERALRADTFLARLFDVFTADLADDLAKHMHGPERGLGRLTAQRAALPTRLPTPFEQFLTAGDAQYVLTGTLSKEDVLSELRNWSAFGEIRRNSVAPTVADIVTSLGFNRPRSFGICELVRYEIGSDRRVGPEIAARLGKVLTPSRVDALESEERHDLLALFRNMTFSMADGSWRSVALHSRESRHLDDEERKILEFAPESEMAAPGYTGAADDLYDFASQQSGYQRTARAFASWAVSMDDRTRRSALLRYVIEGRQGLELATALGDQRPGWLPATSQELKQSDLVVGWSKGDLARLLSLLYPEENRLRWDQPREDPPPLLTDPKEFLEQAHAWWRDVYEDERRDYDAKVLPAGFSPGALRNRGAAEDREGWFTFFALGAFRTIGFGHETAHATFVNHARAQGWWREMSEAGPSEDAAPWVARLRELADPLAVRIEYFPWRRMLSDLYVIARWLDDYVDVFLHLPDVARQSKLKLSYAWQVSASPLWQHYGYEGAPLTQSLGVGANWMIREAIRHGLWTGDDAVAMHPYAWATTARLRRLFEMRLGEPLGERADMDLAPFVHESIRAYLGDRADFLGDLDLPLQILAVRETIGGEPSPSGTVREHVRDVEDKEDEEVI
ncbi:sacsin N-terminal ATP-binding-like domain-containing protein [Lutibaculum baratangense]|uniref:Sacsin/Nov domain-containing protein n=1 Tax=Lutibaculum baratangense AMV1 TaxID=631454 RepID=V4RM10_9HYPH|nr:S1C family serine protease [Lutibaculum baratangense]ESR26344.1 hypothetical protein N177_0844 [Lutibaculum baratangense AMV1]